MLICYLPAVNPVLRQLAARASARKLGGDQVRNRLTAS